MTDPDSLSSIASQLSHRGEFPQDDACFQKALEKLKTKYYVRLLEDEIEKDPSKYFSCTEMVSYITSHRCPRSSYFMVTISPKVDTTLQYLKKQIEKAVLKVFIKHYIYVYELRDDGTPHIHLVINTTSQMKRSEVFRRFSNTFKHCCDSTSLDVIPTSDRMRFHSYISGIKGGIPKPNYQKDKQYRETNKLSSFYTDSNHWPPLLDRPV